MADARCPFFEISPNRSAAVAVWARLGAEAANSAHLTVQRVFGRSVQPALVTTIQLLTSATTPDP